MSRYHTPMRATWFLERPGFVRFMARELTAIFVLGYLVYLILWIRRLGQGPEAYAAAIESARHPAVIALHAIALVGAVYHSITWFNLTPRIMPMYLGEDRLPDGLAAMTMGYLPWVAMTALVMWRLLG